MRVLIIEDDKDLGEALTKGLEDESFSWDWCKDGIDGSFKATTEPYDAIILDIMLPGRNGYVVCKEIREAGVWTPILMLTAKDGEFDEAEALDTGADDFLSKPFSFVVLLARLRALMRRGTRERPAVLTVGDLQLDPAAKRFWRGESEINLTPRQFALMELFMRRPGEALSKVEILDNVWDFTYEGDPNIVEVYIKRLRKKVDEPFGRAALTTVRSAGYRLEADGG